MTTDSGPFVWLLYARRAIMPTILHDNNTDQQAAEQTSCEISRNVAMARLLPGAGVGVVQEFLEESGGASTFRSVHSSSPETKRPRWTCHSTAQDLTAAIRQTNLPKGGPG